MDPCAAGAQKALSRPDADAGFARAATTRALRAPELRPSVCTPAPGYVPVIDSGRRAMPAGRAAPAHAQGVLPTLAGRAAQAALERRVWRRIPRLPPPACSRIAQTRPAAASGRTWLCRSAEYREAVRPAFTVAE